MQKIIRDVDEKKGIVQVTIADERWYLKSIENPTTGIPEYKAVPSVTWIAGKYPKGIGFYKWLADKGWDESQAIKEAAGVKGTKVHQAITDILNGKEVRIDSKYQNSKTGEMEELSLEECDAILSFIDWRNEKEKEYIFEPIVWDFTVFSEKYNYAGTIDLVLKLTHRETNEVIYLVVDFKTSSDVWTEYELQVNAYKKCLAEESHDISKLKDVKDYKMMILQLNYKRNKTKKYKETDIAEKFPLFLSARDIWANEHDGEAPNKKSYPIVLHAEIKKEDVKEKTNEQVK